MSADLPLEPLPPLAAPDRGGGAWGRRSATRLVVLGMPAALAWLLPTLGDRSLLVNAALWAEPLGWMAATTAALFAVLDGRPARMLGIVAAALATIAVLHRPVPVGPPAPGSGAWGQALRACARVAPAPEGPVRVAQLARGPAGLDAELGALLDSEAGLFVLYGFDRAEADAVAAAVLGEARHAQGTPAHRSLSVVVRGSFQRCGDDAAAPAADLWQRSLPSTTDRGALAALTFPVVRGAGVLPLLTFRLDGAGPAVAWPAWPGRQADGVQVLHELIEAVGSRHLLVVGEALAPLGRRSLFLGLGARGLRRAALPWTWPGRVSSGRQLRLHPVEGVWTGAELTPGRTGRVRRSGTQRSGTWVEVAAPRR